MSITYEKSVNCGDYLEKQQKNIEQLFNTSLLKSLSSSSQLLNYKKIGIYHFYNYSIENLEQNEAFLKTWNRLLELAEEEDLEDDDEVFRPTDYAFSNSFFLLMKLYQLLGESFPLGYSNVDSRGGINLIWKNRKFDKEVRVKLPFSQEFKQSVYYRQNDNSKLVKNLSSEEISNLLIWLYTAQSINSL